MAGPPKSIEPPRRRILRLTIGVTLAIVVAQLFAWPLSFVMPVFTAILLQGAEAMTLREARRSIGFAVICLLVAAIMALFLSNYPLVMIIVFILLIYQVFFFALTSGAHLLAIVAALISGFVMPLATRIYPDLGWVVALCMILNLAAAFLISRLSFLLVPAPAQPSGNADTGADRNQASVIATDITLVVAPLLAAFLVFGWTQILVLVYGALFATGLGVAGSTKMGFKYLRANLVYAGLGTLLIYEILVMAPFLPLMIALFLFATFLFARGIFAGDDDAAVWASGLNGFVILSVSLLTSESAVADAKVIDRAMQIVLATLYVVFAYSVLDAVRSLGRGRSGTDAATT